MLQINTISTGDVAKLLGTSAQTIINWSTSGRLEYQRIGTGPRRILVSSVLSLLESEHIDPVTLNQDILKRISSQMAITATHSSLGVEIAIGVLEAEVTARGIKACDDLGIEKIKGADVLTSIEILKRTLIKK